MTALKPGTLALMLAVIAWGTLLGGIVYCHVVFFPVYLSALPDSAVLVNGKYPVEDSRFWTIAHPMLILSLIVALALNWKEPARRRLLLMSTAVHGAALVATTLYFVPELRAFRSSPESSVSPAEWLARGERWQHLSWLRGACSYAGFVPLLLALMQPADTAPAAAAS